MDRQLKVMTIFGTRPEAIKMAPLVQELKKRPEFLCKVCVTAQHRQMLDQVLDIFHIVPDYDLDVMEPNQTLSGITTRVLSRLDRLFEEDKPDMVLVHGDTTTTLAGALAAFYHKIPVGHVEAGLRTGDRYSPFPEEMNRRLTSSLASIHFAPTESNAENLREEKVVKNVYITGNTVIDAMKQTIAPDYRFENPFLREFDFSGKRVVLLTAHRRENYGEPFENIMGAVRELATTGKDLHFIYPVHLSPIVQKAARDNLSDLGNVSLIEPLSVTDMHNLMARAYLVMTDSGGLQEEAPALGKPVLLLRRETERPEGVAAGTVRLAGVERQTILSMTRELLHSKEAYEKMALAANPYGDGWASRRIADYIIDYFSAQSSQA